MTPMTGSHLILRQFFAIMDQILWEARENPGKASTVLSTMTGEIRLLSRQIEEYSSASRATSRETLSRLSER